MVVLWALQANPYLNVANDAGRYTTLGESLAQTGELRLLNDIKRPLDTLYPPGFPAIIAFWLRVTGAGPGGVVRYVKGTLLVLLITLLPFYERLLRRARLPSYLVPVALLTFALTPSLVAYANDVMSEIPYLFFCLIAVVLVERRTHPPLEKAEPSIAARIGSLLCGVAAFLTRSAGFVLLLALAVWFWRRFGWKWGVLATLTALIAVGGWQLRNRHIIRHAAPGVTYSSYLDQFSLRDPMRPGAGRIQLNAKGLALRAYEGIPAYLGMIPRAILHTMSLGTAWFPLFYIVAVPCLLLILWGFAVAWRRGLGLSCGFAALFWFSTAMWPWRSPRFLVPIVPFLLLFLFLGVAWIIPRLKRRAGKLFTVAVEVVATLLLWTYFLEAHAQVIRQENRPTAPGYALGRTRAEGGFYAACDWLQKNTPPGSLVMGRPAYLLHLYSGRPTTQIEPTTNPRAQELAYMRPRHVRYLLQDAWDWSNTPKYLGAYFQQYSDKWTLAWKDPRGSGVRVWQRKPEGLPLAR